MSVSSVLSNSTLAHVNPLQFWGPVTATLDWCEANYQFSNYIAEAANTFSNLFTVGLAIWGAYQAYAQSLPPRYFIGHAGFALVGVGSFIFHATLLFEAQLADELPMIYVSSYCCAVLFDTARGFGLRDSPVIPLAVGFVTFNVLFTWSYYLSRNPVYHQAVFAGLLVITGVRTVHLLRDAEIAKRVPQHVKTTVARLFGSGAGTFALGFFIWNLDNVFCDTITRWKHALGWPAAFILEGHSWWHILTATGTYLMLVGNTCLSGQGTDVLSLLPFFGASSILGGLTGLSRRTLCIKDDHRNFRMRSLLGVPSLERVGGAKTKAQ